MARHRQLWPSSDSRFLSNNLYCFRYRDCDLVSHESLIYGSDDELDHGQRRAKRRRVEHLARSFLDGRGLLIPSASLRGPFGATCNENDPPSDDDRKVLVSTKHPGLKTDKSTLPPARRDHGRSEAGVMGGDVALLAAHWDIDDGPSQSSDQGEFAGVRTLTHTPSSSPPRDCTPSSAIADLEAAIDASDSPIVLTNRPVAPNPPLSSFLEGIKGAKRLSTIAISQREDDLKGIKEAKRLSQSTFAPPCSGKSAGRRLEHGKDAFTNPSASSPFLFRYKRTHRTEAPIKKEKSRTGWALEAVEQASEVWKAEDVCAGKSRTHVNDVYDVPSDTETPPNCAKVENDTPKQMVSTPELSHPIQQTTHFPDRQEINISTQAALQEAGRDLLVSSPRQGLLSPMVSGRRPHSPGASQSPAPAVTPFARLHERFIAPHEGTQQPYISTQAMLDDFSPFKISPMKTGMTQLSPHQDPRQALASQRGTTGAPDDALVAATNGTGWSFAALDKSPVPRNCEHHSRRSKSPVRSRPTSGFKELGFKVTKSSSQSQSKSSTQSQPLSQTARGGSSASVPKDEKNECPLRELTPSAPSQDIDKESVAQLRKQLRPLASQSKKPPKSQRSRSLSTTKSQSVSFHTVHPASQPALSRQHSEVNRSRTPSRPHTFALSQIINDVSTSDPWGYDYPAIVSHVSLTSQDNGRRSLPVQKLGGVEDWDADSEAGEDGLDRVNVEGATADTLGSRVKDSVPTRPPNSSAGSFAAPSFPASRARLTFESNGSQSPQKTGLSTLASGSQKSGSGRKRGGLKSSMRKSGQTPKSSVFQDAQREETLNGEDLDTSVDDLKGMLGGWDVEEDLKGL
ncbi:hypothetical protein CAC42_5294 [Sphaceloma murrayae]|uniref:Uncharacterized protein n=1 Tax=Sphaceloma murrayae TaxID=2082308 RepID=A0A2K1QUL6_9PEZI|nr:hypothetical protein CAC42_5294 [Sphaceloma murrayae]